MSTPLMSCDMQLSGLADLEQALADLGDAVGAKVLKAALREAAKPMLDNAQARAPEAEKAYYRYTSGRRKKGEPRGKGTRRLVPSGTLRRSLRLRQIKPDRIGGGIDAAVTLDVKKDAFYWWMVEKGTEKTPAQPYLRPAFDDEYKTVSNSFADILRKRIDRAKRAQLRRQGA